MTNDRIALVINNRHELLIIQKDHESVKKDNVLTNLQALRV